MSVTITIVLFDSADDIAGCLAAVEGQSLRPDSVVVFDNGSTDGGLEIARRCLPDAKLIRSESNVGFAAGHNAAMRAAPADVHVVLNPDCRLAPGFLMEAVGALHSDPRIGSVSGRLLRFHGNDIDGGRLEELPDDRLDSTGMVAFRNRRVLDRDTDAPAAGTRLEPDDVFGTSGAAAVYRRAMLEDCAFGDEIFDESFFAYREDVDLAWRAQLLGWSCRYAPAALARHRRRVAPGRRRSLPHRINRLSVANRWRMIAKNEIGAGWQRDWAPIIARDLLILGHTVVREWRTLGAIPDVLGDARTIRMRRRDIMRRRRADDADMLRWFQATSNGAGAPGRIAP